MPNVKDIVLGRKIWCLCVGPHGSGKTVFETSFPGRTYVFDCDGRMDSVRLMHMDREDIDYDTYTQSDWQAFDEKCESLKGRERGKYKNVVLASLTSFCRMALAYSLAHRGESEGKDNKRGKISLYDVVDFNVEARTVIDMINDFREMKCNFFLEAHLMKVTERPIIKERGEPSETIKYRVITGAQKVAQEIPTLFNDVYYFKRERQGVAGVGSGPADKYIILTTGLTGFEGYDLKKSLPISDKIDWTDKDPYKLIESQLLLKGIKLNPEGGDGENKSPILPVVSLPSMTSTPK